MKKSLKLKSYSKFKGNLKGTPYIGTIGTVEALPFVYKSFNQCFKDMAIYNEKRVGKIYYDAVESSWLPHSRNTLANHMVGDFLFMIDTDQYFNPDLTERMLKVFNQKGRELAVLSGVYLYKKRPFWPALYMFEETTKKYRTIRDWQSLGDEELDVFEIAAAGAGCLMIRKWVFEYIRQELHEEPFETRKPFDNPDEPVLGEDLSFFDRCRQLDIQVVTDPRIRIGHLTTKSVEAGVEYEPHIIDLDYSSKK